MLFRSNGFAKTARLDTELVEPDDNISSGEEDDDDNASVTTEDQEAQPLEDHLNRQRQESVIQQEQGETTVTETS